ncbi:MAG: hypothetical protein WED82_02080 [Balneolales bacterium]
MEPDREKILIRTSRNYYAVRACLTGKLKMSSSTRPDKKSVPVRKKWQVIDRSFNNQEE